MKTILFLMSLVSLSAFADQYKCQGRVDFGTYYDKLVYLDISYNEDKVYLKDIKLTNSKSPTVKMRNDGKLLISYRLRDGSRRFRENDIRAILKEGKQFKTLGFYDQDITWSRMFFSIIKKTNQAKLVYELNSRVQMLVCERK